MVERDQPPKREGMSHTGMPWTPAGGFRDFRLPDAESKNDRTKLGFHRIVARLLSRRPEMVGEAREIVEGLDPGAPRFVHEWLELLQRPVPEIRREITRRDPEMFRLRSTSPFYRLKQPVLTQDQRVRLRERMTRCLRARDTRSR